MSVQYRQDSYLAAGGLSSGATISYSAIPAATPAFSDSTEAVIGMEASVSQASRTSRDKPVALAADDQHQRAGDASGTAAMSVSASPSRPTRVKPASA